jgi:hypothetical protein
VVYADFSACIDAVLSFPEFNQPGTTHVIKIDGFTVEYHVKTGRRFVKQGAIAEFPLPCILPGGDDILIREVGKAERLEQTVQSAYFFAAFHTADFPDDTVFLSVIDDQKKYTDNDTYSEEEIHRKVLSRVYLSYVVEWMRGTGKREIIL